GQRAYSLTGAGEWQAGGDELLLDVTGAQ
ncbi:MAG: hypothetical protein QOH91_4443, partial [Mycobacterium sp.]|nr:hypothetical protein [Mycobacterium sp.]